MLSVRLVLLGFVALTVVANESHVIEKRGLISRLFSERSKSDRGVDEDLPPRERSKFRELLKNPVVISMLTAAVGMAVQKALQTKNMNDVCENQYVRMAMSAGSFSPELQSMINLLGCNAPNRKFGGSSTAPNKKFPKPSMNDEEENENENEDQDNSMNDNETLESAFPPERESKLKLLANIARGEKGAKRNFIKHLFGLNKKDNTFKAGHKLPSSSYKLDKDDAKALKELDKELEKYNSIMH